MGGIREDSCVTYQASFEEKCSFLLPVDVMPVRRPEEFGDGVPRAGGSRWTMGVNGMLGPGPGRSSLSQGGAFAWRSLLKTAWMEPHAAPPSSLSQDNHQVHRRCSGRGRLHTCLYFPRVFVADVIRFNSKIRFSQKCRMN